MRVCIGTWNAGPGDKSDLLKLMDQTDVLAGQEWGDRAALSAFAEHHGWKVIEAHNAGLKSTPVLVSPNAKIRREVELLLLHRQYIGAGAGPDHNKDKGAVGGLLSMSSEVIGVASTHLVASSYTPLRHKAAAKHIDGLERKFTKRKYPWFVCGDFNTTPDSDLLRPLYRAGWTNSHRAGRELDTHGNRTIDYIWWRKSRGIDFIKHRTVKTHSDHNALVAEFEVNRG